MIVKCLIVIISIYFRVAFQGICLCAGILIPLHLISVKNKKNTGIQDTQLLTTSMVMKAQVQVQQGDGISKTNLLIEGLVGETGSQYRNYDAAFGTILTISKGFHVEGSKIFTFIFSSTWQPTSLKTSGTSLKTSGTKCLLIL